jgi:hypothetical protein
MQLYNTVRDVQMQRVIFFRNIFPPGHGKCATFSMTAWKPALAASLWLAGEP